ncbi:protein rhiB [Corallococcus coralloides DSM 2259]|uniref:Protein rhiB n=1 Tax=Corallococcus coralloides (strain ATCC 25202 / DSM 2259 / NBRC 100086 / M2) TaxID=1144275 RepID=H8N0Y1_CORCM|nr:phage tail protein [Corallococcus coralloides]AFE10129.1 protein rhiB [Corallococcus coralloides DSM 2259]
MRPCFPGAPPLPFAPFAPFAPGGPLTGEPPVGSLVAFAGEVAGRGSDSQHATPAELEGWLVCDGRPLAKGEYPELFAAIGHRYSPTEDGDTFLLPDLQGVFLRGVDAKGQVDKDQSQRTMVSGTAKAEVGSLQPHALQLHEHQLTQASAFATPSQQGTEAGSSVTLTGQTSAVIDDPKGTAPLKTSPTETRPVNVYVYFLIKARRAIAPGLAGAVPGVPHAFR